MIQEIGDRFPTFENTTYTEMVARGERNYRLFGGAASMTHQLGRTAGLLRRLITLISIAPTRGGTRRA